MAIKFIIASTEGFLNKAGLTQNIAQAKSYNTLASAKQHLVDGEWIERIETVTQFGQTSTTALGKVDAAEVEAAEAIPVVPRDDKAVFILTDDEGLYFNKKGFTEDVSKALTSPNPDYLAGFVAKTGATGYLHSAVSRYEAGTYVLTDISDIIVEIPVDVAGVKVIDDEIQVFVKG